MSISPRLSSYLSQAGADYKVCVHEHSHSSAETARRAGVPEHRLAKSVILEDDRGCVMAVIPANRQLLVREVGHLLERPALHLADEPRIAKMFSDCDRGAVPPFGMAWGMETIVDEEIEENSEVYVEGGDHEELLRMSGEQFRRLMQTARHGHFCREKTY